MKKDKIYVFPNLGGRLLDCTFDLKNATSKFYICYSAKSVRAQVGTLTESKIESN